MNADRLFGQSRRGNHTQARLHRVYEALLVSCLGGETTTLGRTVTFEVSGVANLYQQTDPETRTSRSTDPIRVPDARLAPGQQIGIVATGCVVDASSSCTDADGGTSLYRGLPVYSLIGRWSRSPDILDAATAASDPLCVGSNTVLTAPLEEGDYYLSLGENDGGFNDNAGAYIVTASWTALPIELGLTISQKFLWPGDTLAIGLEAHNSGLELSADVYLGVILPDGVTACFITEVSPSACAVRRLTWYPRTFRPLAANLMMPADSQRTIVPLLTWPFQGQVPEGLYQLGSCVTSVH